MSFLIDFLHASARTRPQAEAVVYEQRRVSYGELWRDVEAVARFLRARGLPPGGRVALVAENSPEYIAAYYGVLAAGGTVVALNTAARERDLLNWITHSGATWLFAHGGHTAWPALSRLCGVNVVRIGDASGAGIPWCDVLASAPVPGMADPRPLPDSPAAIIYTSGTTGRPKGVTLSHRNLAANVRSILSYLPLGADARTLNVLPFYYSYGNSVLHTHLAAGGCLILENSLTYPHRVVERIAQESVTGFNGVPSTYALLLSRVNLESYDLSALRYVTQAGGAMSPATITRLAERLPHVRIYVMYGQTEATSRLSYLPPEMLPEKLGSAGIAIPGVTLEIRGEDGRVVPSGTVGEICARGDNIMLGYWDDPETTATVLVNGWLKTGDLAHMDDDGYLYIQGRRSDMIKSGAHRINPMDIEEAIAELEGVAEVAVVGVEDEILGQVIKAVVVPRPGETLEAMQVRAHCRERLASYKIPKYVEFAKALPRTASGKIKRFELVGEDRANIQEKAG